MNVAFQHVREALMRSGPLTADQLKATLTQFRPYQVNLLLNWAVDNGRVVDEGGVYSLTDRGRR